MSKAIEGVAMIGAALGLALGAAFFDPSLLFNPAYDDLIESLFVGGVAMEAAAAADALLSNRGMNITSRQPAAFRQIIYGERRVGGIMIYCSTTGSKHDQYNMVIVWAGHECDTIVNVYLDGRQIYWLGSGAGWVVRNGIGSGGVADGSNHVGPDGQQYNFGGTGHSGIYFDPRFGDQSDGDVIGALTANDPHWTTTSAGSPWVGGCCYAYLKIEYDQSLFPSFPQIKATIRGKNDIFDPRTGTRGWTNNWALIVADILTNQEFGLGDVDGVNQDQLIAAANICDEMVPFVGGGGGLEARYTCNWMTDTSTAPGDMLQTLMSCAAGRLSRIGGEWYIWPAYWQGPSFSFDETVLTAPVQWNPYRSFKDLWNRITGTYIAPNYPYSSQIYPSDLYDSNGWYNGSIANNWPFAWQPTNYPQYAQDPLHGYATDALLNADSGVAGVYAAGTTYAAGAVVSYIQTVDGVDFATVWESLVGSNTGNTPPSSPSFWQNAAILLPKEITQPACISIAQAQRVAKIMLLRNRQQGSGTIEMNLSGLQLQPVTVFEQTFAALAWSGKQLEVVNFRTTVDRDSKGDGSNVPMIRVQMDVQETDSSVYDWDASTEELTIYDVPNSPTQSPSTIAAPTGLTLTSNSGTAVTSIDGLYQPRILAAWTDPASVVVTQIQVQYRLHGGSSWTDVGSVAVGVQQMYISGVVAGQVYDVQIRGLAQTGATSAWLEVDNCTISTTASLPLATGSTPGVITAGTGLAVSGGVLSLAGGGGGSFNPDILSPDKPTGTLAYHKNEFATVTAGSTLNLLNYSGGSPGYVDWLTLQLKDTGSADPSNMTVNVYYDGSGTPTISCPLQNFFMATYAILNGPTAVSSCFHGFTSNHSNSQVSFYFRLPIPFTTGVKIDLVNTTAHSFAVWSACEYQTGVPNTWPYTRKLRIDTTQLTGLAANSVNTLVNYSGGAKGRFVGLWLLEDDFPGSVSPHGATLEGNINLYLDGSGTESAQSSGTEDWFGGGFYFAGNGTGGTGGGNSSQVQPGYKDGSGQIGVTYMSATAFLTEGAFRFHVSDKRYFNSGLKLTWQCGDTSEISFTGTGTIFTSVYYYTES